MPDSNLENPRSNGQIVIPNYDEVFSMWDLSKMVAATGGCEGHLLLAVSLLSSL
jgi:hypothetical protein